MIRFFATHHNKIQFFGYEVANIVWLLHNAYQQETTGYGLNFETCTALFFLTGSALIWRFDPEKRPQMLFYGGMALAIGGLFLTAAGFALTGLAVVLASLETARGGLRILQQLVVDNRQSPHRHSARLASTLLGWYQKPIEAMAAKFHQVGHFIDERPFVTGAFIKAPLRLEFIGKKVLLGDWIGAAVGLSWMLLGDMALAFNDDKLQAHVQDIPNPQYRIA